MDAKEALAKIKEAEQKAEQDVRQARSRAIEILEAVQRDNEQLLNAARDKAKADGEKFLIQSEAETRDEIARLGKETTAEISNIRKKAAKAADKAMDFIISKLDK